MIIFTSSELNSILPTGTMDSCFHVLMSKIELYLDFESCYTVIVLLILLDQKLYSNLSTIKKLTYKEVVV